MTTRNVPFAPGTPCWVDLASSDTKASIAFYDGVFGWSHDVAGEEFGGYVQFFSDGHPVAGMVGNPPEFGRPDAWTTYLSSTDVATTVASAAAAGAEVVAPPMQVGEVGSMAILVDPAGAVVGLWQPGTHFGFTKYNEPGSVTWDEHHSKDFATSLAFYESVFGWGIERTADTDEFRYFQGQIDGQTVAGLMDSAAFLPPEVPSHWAVYFSVTDADATAASVVALGGSVVRGPEDTPFGRIADLLDTTGASFKIHTAGAPAST